ncbi:guanine nucleotide-binding protein G(f) subunit alpha [Onthophagus taurus]|uniref:guanine nucleotide-binding protein G(f) subunit alpha n=1 Tax=Onthophagus taurus TaxID=166361 RepID=UPI000C200234|nr:guanine nucleotide-binding protein G(f) subunit alpha [Onthophagus taurus]
MFMCLNPKHPDDVEAESHSKKIDEQLKKDFKAYSTKIKLLLLGTGESGKTTIIKQMKILHINGFSEDEKKEKIPDIWQNIHESIYSIVNNLIRIEPPLEIKSEDVKKSEEFILNIGPNTPETFTDEYCDHVKKLWLNETIQAAYSRSNEYQLIDSAKHFLDKLDTIRKKDYIPDIQDILYCRKETVSITHIDFTMQVPRQWGGGQANFSMFDVGGQRGHRRKWISVFEGIRAILFLIASSDFDQTLREDENKNRLEEAFTTFEQIYWSRYVCDAGIIVFFNKQDILKKKIEDGKKLENYFPEFRNYQISSKYGKPNNEYERAKYFIHEQIVNITKKTRNTDEVKYVLPGVSGHVKTESRPFYTHFTIATDTNNIKLVFEDVRDLILNINTKNIIL